LPCTTASHCIGARKYEKDVKQYHAWGGGLTFALWTDVQRGKEGSFSITEVPGTPLPAWFKKILRSKKNLADLEKIPLIDG
jgi:hypothetical protein